MKKVKYITTLICNQYILLILISLLTLFFTSFYLIILILLVSLLPMLSIPVVKKIYNHNPRIDDYLLKNQEKLKNKLTNLIDIANAYQDDFNKLGYRISFDINYEQDNRVIKKVPKKNRNLYNPIIVYGVYEMKDVLCTQDILYDKKDLEVEINKMQNIYNNDKSLKEDLTKWLDDLYKVKGGNFILFKECYEIPYRLWKNIKYIPSTWTLPYYILVDSEGKSEFSIKYYGEILFKNHNYQLNPINGLAKLEACDDSSNPLLIADNTIDTDQPVEKASPQVNHVFHCHKCHNDTFKIKLEYSQIEEQDINEEKYTEIEKDYKIISQCYYKVIITAYCTKCGRKHLIIYKA